MKIHVERAVAGNVYEKVIVRVVVLFDLRAGRNDLVPNADVVVFDENEVGLGETYTRFDLPAGAGRLYADATGIAHVIVNGIEIIRDNEHTGAFPGTVLQPAMNATFTWSAFRPNPPLDPHIS